MKVRYVHRAEGRREKSGIKHRDRPGESHNSFHKGVGPSSVCKAGFSFLEKWVKQRISHRCVGCDRLWKEQREERGTQGKKKKRALASPKKQRRHLILRQVTDRQDA